MQYVLKLLVRLDSQSPAKAGSLPGPQGNNPAAGQTWIKFR